MANIIPKVEKIIKMTCQNLPIWENLLSMIKISSKKIPK